MEKVICKRIVFFLCVVIVLSMNISAYSQSLDFYAYYTRLDYEDDNNTGKYADIVVNAGQLGKFVFSREYSYLPYWQVSQTKHFVGKIIPINGDGPARRPDRINKCSYVRIIENSSDKVIVHWRYAPNQNSDNFTDFKRTYSGDIGKYYADYVDEYFTINADATVIRRVKKGCYKLDDWNDPLNEIRQELELTSSGITIKNTTPAKLQNLPGKAVPRPAIINKGVQSPVVWMRFDEGLNTNQGARKQAP